MAVRPPTGRPQRQRGYSYMLALFALSILALMSTRALESQKTAGQREREEELLFVGKAYRAAIAQYYQQTPGTLKRFPPDLQALLLDQRSAGVRRPLRKLYRDPMGGGAQWGTVSAPDGGVMGVYSLAAQAPIKTDGFPIELVSFKGASSYREWKFIYVPR